MPLYEFKCDICGNSHDVLRPMRDSSLPGPDCCGATTRRVYTPQLINVGEDVRYRCPVTGKTIQSDRQRRRVLDEHGLVDARDYASVWARNQQKERDERAEAAKYYSNLPDVVKATAQDAIDEHQ